MNNLCENLKKIRKDNHLSQEQLADELGVSRQAISKWESGVAYPEMEKIVQICQKFDLNIDDLLNKDIRETKKEKEGKIRLNKYIEDFLNFITDTVNFFSHMSLKTKLTCFIEQFILIMSMILIFLMIASVFKYIIPPIFYAIFPPRIYDVLYSLLIGLYVTFSLVLGIIILVHVFKVRYLDYYAEVKKIEKKEEVVTLKEEKIIIRNPKDYKFIQGICKLCICLLKCFSIFILLFFAMLLLFVLTIFVISFKLYKTGFFFVGLLFGSLSVSVILVLLILLFLNFIFNRKNEIKKMIFSFIASICALGFSFGFVFLGSLDFKVEESILKKESMIKVDMQKDLVLLPHTDFTYIEKEIDDIEITYKLANFCNIHKDEFTSNGKHEIMLWHDCPDVFLSMKSTLKEINDNKVFPISNNLSNIKVYASKENIATLKKNQNEYEEVLKKQEEEYQNRQSEIYNLQKELEEKDVKIKELEEKIIRSEN